MNPFLINNYISPEYFCDRENESRTLISYLTGGSNTAFFAQRRIGKTALIKHVLYLLARKKITVIYIDIFASRNLKDMADMLANGMYSAFPPDKGLGKLFWNAIKLLRPVISIDETTGTPRLSLDITKPRQFENTIPQLLNFLDSRNKKIIVAFDEFQQILNYPEKNVEAIMRTCIQQLKNINFIFCGSNLKMMHHIFNNSKQPFYASASNINLKRIEKKNYSDFIKKHFENHKFRISDNDVGLILDLTDSHTYYTQKLCHEIFERGIKKINHSIIMQTLNNIVTDNEAIYFQYRSLITKSQWNLLKAIATEQKLEQPYSSKFISAYNLGNSSNVKRVIESLSDKELIYYNLNTDTPYYEVSDKFLMYWLRHK